MASLYSGVAELVALNQDREYDNKAVFRFDIDETYPETVYINITNDRWHKLGKPTELWIDIRNTENETEMM